MTYVFRARRKYFKRLGKGAIVLKLNKALREFTHFDVGIIYNHFTFIMGGETHDLTGYTSWKLFIPIRMHKKFTITVIA